MYNQATIAAVIAYNNTFIMHIISYTHGLLLSRSIGNLDVYGCLIQTQHTTSHANIYRKYPFIFN